MSYWYPVTAVVDFKQAVYRQALTQLASRLAQVAQSAQTQETALMLEVLRRLVRT